MSIDRSLKSSGGMSQTRSVLTRDERIAKMVADQKMDLKKNGKALGLPKTRVGKK
ncbi:MAG: small basic protein [Phycisphaerales bacterium]|nr:small basic protein [Phycisphaeraceae bacterium]